MKIARIKHIPALILVLSLLCTCRRKAEIPAPDPVPVYHFFEGQTATPNNTAVLTYDGNMVICGNKDGRIIVLKITKGGSLIWKKTLNPGGFSNVAAGVTESDDHSLFICGTAASDSLKEDVLLIKTDDNGNILWTKTYGSDRRDFAKNMIKNSDGHILIAAQTEGSGISRYFDLYFLKLNVDGDTLWTKTYVESGEEAPLHLLETSDKGYLFTCYHTEGFDLPHLYFLKAGPQGDILWTKSDAGQISGTTSMEMPGGELLTCGNDMNNSYAVLLKMDKVGNILWQKTYRKDQNAYWYAESIVANQDYSYTMTGPYDLFQASYIFVLKVDAEGRELFYEKFSDNARESGEMILKDDNDDNLIVGRSGRNRIFITRVGVNGEFK